MVTKSKEKLIPSRDDVQTVKRSSQVSVSVAESPHSPGIRHFITPLLSDDAMNDIPSNVVEIDASTLPTPEEFISSLSKSSE